jgi:hypothetical protein
MFSDMWRTQVSVFLQGEGGRAQLGNGLKNLECCHREMEGFYAPSVSYYMFKEKQSITID